MGRTLQYEKGKGYTDGAPRLATRVDQDVYEYWNQIPAKEKRPLLERLLREDRTKRQTMVSVDTSEKNLAAAPPGWGALVYNEEKGPAGFAYFRRGGKHYVVTTSAPLLMARTMGQGLLTMFTRSSECRVELCEILWSWDDIEARATWTDEEVPGVDALRQRVRLGNDFALLALSPQDAAVESTVQSASVGQDPLVGAQLSAFTIKDREGDDKSQAGVAKFTGWSFRVTENGIATVSGHTEEPCPVKSLLGAGLFDQADDLVGLIYEVDAAAVQPSGTTEVVAHFYLMSTILGHLAL